MNGIITLKKHVDVKHYLLAKKIDKEINSLVKSELERQLAKNRQNVSSSEISEFFIAKVPCKKENAQLKQILEDLVEEICIAVKSSYCLYVKKDFSTRYYSYIGPKN
jgi:hypothetical protein